jgi:hypothetical protein
MRIIEQEEVLMVLLERRKRLVEENEELEARRVGRERPLPRVPVEGGNEMDGQGRGAEADLIDIAEGNERGGMVADEGFTPFVSDTGVSTREEGN